MVKNKDTLREKFVGVDCDIKLPSGILVKACNFDNAATTPPMKNVIRNTSILYKCYGSIGRGTGQKQSMTTHYFEEAREYILDFFNARYEDKYTAIFVNNTTCGINKIASTLLYDKRVILTTRMEHHSNDLPWRKKAVVDYVEVLKDGRIDYESLKEKLKEHEGNIRFLSITGASNVTGYINDIHKIAKMVHKAGGKIVVDGAQLVPHKKVQMCVSDPEENIDFLVFSGHKLYAPFGSGVIVGLKDEFNKCCPEMEGGGTVKLVNDFSEEYLNSPEKNEAGTPNFFGAMALMYALKEIESIGYDTLLNHEKSLFKDLLNGLRRLDKITNYGDIENIDDRLGIGVFNLDGVFHEDLAKALADRRGIAVRHGWFCAHPYCRRLMNLTEEESSRFLYDENYKMYGMVRVSIGPYNTKEEIDILLNELEYLNKR